MVRVITNTVSIDADAARVWAVLIDFDDRSDWDPYYHEIRGALAPGARLIVRASLNDTSRLVTSRPRVRAVEPCELLAWSNCIVMPGLLDSTNEFRLTAPEPGVTVLHQTEEFSGVLVRPLTGVLDDIEVRLRAWVEAVKHRAEAQD